MGRPEVSIGNEKIIPEEQKWMDFFGLCLESELINDVTAMPTEGSKIFRGHYFLLHTSRPRSRNERWRTRKQFPAVGKSEQISKHSVAAADGILLADIMVNQIHDFL